MTSARDGIDSADKSQFKRSSTANFPCHFKYPALIWAQFKVKIKDFV